MKRIRPKPATVALGWSFLVLVSLFLPGSTVPQSDVLEYDKAVHALLFGVGVYLWLRVPWTSGMARWIIVLGALAFAPASEIFQAMIGGGRAADPWDAVADAIGVALGAGAWFLAFRTEPDGGSQPATPRNDGS